VLSDAATSVPWLVAMSLIGAAGWFVFGKALTDSHWYPELSLLMVTPVAMLAILLCGGLGMAALLESVGRKVTGLVVILGGILPLMLGVILAVSSDDFVALAVWLAGMCPLTWPVFGSGVFLPQEGMPRDVARAVPNAFGFWLFVGGILTVWLLTKLKEARGKISERSKEF
jgi:hypothetical protein